MVILGKGMSQRDGVPGEPDRGRRHFLGRAAITLAAARFGRLRAGGASASLAGALAEGTSEANAAEARQLAALGRPTGWLNSPPLSAPNLLGKVVLV